MVREALIVAYYTENPAGRVLLPSSSAVAQ